MLSVLLLKCCSVVTGCVTGVREGQLAVISRTNYELFREVANYCQQDPDNVKVAFIGVLT